MLVSPVPVSPAPAGEGRITDLVQAYLAAEYRWECDGEWLDLRIGAPAPAVPGRYPAARAAGLLSAWNPYSVVRPDAENRAEDERLQADLVASGCAFRAAFSSSSNRTWREPSWLVIDMAIGAFDALSRRFGQLGTLYWHTDAPVRMRIDAAAPPSLAGHPHIDWLRS